MSGGNRKIEFGSVIGVDAIERLSLLYPIADLLKHLDAGTFVDRRTGSACQAIEPQAVDRLDDPVPLSANVGGQIADIGAAGRWPLSFNDLVHLLERRSGLEQFSRARIAATTAQIGIIFKKMGGKPQRLLAQIGGAPGAFDKTAMTSCDSSTGPMPLPTGWRPSVVTTSTEMPKWSPTNSNSLRSLIASIAVGELGGGANRKINQQMRGAGRELFRHDRSHHLLASINASGRSTEIRMSSAGERLT